MFICIVLTILWFIIVPILMGRLFMETGEENDDRLLSAMPKGYMLLLAILQVLVLPMILLKTSLLTLTVTWAFIISVMSVVSLFLRPIKVVELFRGFARRISTQFQDAGIFFTLMAFTLIISQCALLGYFGHIDDDDAFFVATAVTSYDTDTLFEYNPYSGNLYNKLPSRYVLSPFPMYYAVIAKLTMTHPAVTAHTTIPIIFILLAYVIYWNIGRQLFENNKNAVNIFLIMISVLNIFGNFSAYTTSSFLLFRIWQGKAILANIILPFILYLMLLILKDSKKFRNWFMMFMTMVAGAFVSSMGILLAPLALGVLSFVSIITQKKFMILVKSSLCVLPSLILGLVYLYIR